MSQSVTDSVHLRAGHATHRGQGQGRTVNEDSLGLPETIPAALLARKGYLYLVADGVGGYRAGDIASQMAVELIRRAYYDDPDVDLVTSLQRAIEEANAEIHRQAQDPAYARMGTTVVAAVVRGDQLVVANVGDSRAYLLRQGELRRLTSDHTWVAERMAAGLLTPQETTRHEMRHIVTRSLGAQPTVEADVRPYRLQPGDRLLLCSDGLWEPVPEPEIARTLGHARPQAAAAALVNRAMVAGGEDDTTALVVAAGPAGVLEQVGQVMTNVFASPQQRALVVGAGAVLIIALLICGATRLFPGRAALGPLMTTETPTVQVSPTPVVTLVTPTAPPILLDTPTASPPPPTPSTEPPLSPDPSLLREISEGYCILPSENPKVADDFPAKPLDLQSCQQISGMHGIPVDEDIQVPDENISQNCGRQKIVQVMYDDQPYWIFPWRIGRRSTDGTCQSIENNERGNFFTTRRQQ